jgi:hypothetical protein
VLVPTVIQWTLHLLNKIQEQKRYAEPFERRYRNQHVLPFIAAEYRQVYGAAVDLVMPSLAPPKTGTAAIGIDALVERLTVQGAAAQGDTDDDRRAAQLVQDGWDDNDLDVMHREAHREAAIKARSFASVHRSADGDKAIVGIESPEQMAVHRQSAPPYDVDASLKVTVDEWTAAETAQLRLPGRDIDLVRGDDFKPDPEGSGVWSQWRVVRETATRLPGVPTVEFAWKPRLLAPPESEIERIASEVDIVDLVEGLMVFAGHFGAVPIRFATGLEVPRDPKDPSKPLLGPDGRPMIGFNARADHMWVSTSKDARFGQLTPAGLESFVTWANHASSRIRAMTAVASTYYSLDLKSHMSAELLKTDEAPMVRRVLGMGRDGAFNQAWRRLDRLILQIEAPALANRVRVRPRWVDPQTRIEAADMDRFQKAVASGLGVRAAAEEILGWSPELVERAVTEAEEAKDRDAERAATVDTTLDRIARDLIPTNANA